MVVPAPGARGNRGGMGDLGNYHIRTNQQHKRIHVSLELRRSSLPVASAMRGDMRVLLELSSAPHSGPVVAPTSAVLCACVERESPARIVDRIPARRRGVDTVPRRTVPPTYIRKHEGYRPSCRGKMSHATTCACAGAGNPRSLGDIGRARRSYARHASPEYESKRLEYGRCDYGPQWLCR